jgi:hypothetical protein
MCCKLPIDMFEHKCTNVSAKQGFVRNALIAASAKAA